MAFPSAICFEFFFMTFKSTSQNADTKLGTEFTQLSPPSWKPVFIGFKRQQKDWKPIRVFLMPSWQGSIHEKLLIKPHSLRGGAWWPRWNIPRRYGYLVADIENTCLIRESCRLSHFKSIAPITPFSSGCCIYMRLWSLCTVGSRVSMHPPFYTCLQFKAKCFNEIETQTKPTTWVEPSYFIMFVIWGLCLPKSTSQQEFLHRVTLWLHVPASVFVSRNCWHFLH